MRYKYYKTDEAADLNKDVNPKIILSIISTITTFARSSHANFEQDITKKIADATCFYLVNINDETARDMLEMYQQNILKLGAEIASQQKGRAALDFAHALKLAIDIMSSTKGLNHELWQDALKQKLIETRTMLNKKYNRKSPPLFWDKQANVSDDEQQTKLTLV